METTGLAWLTERATLMSLVFATLVLFGLPAAADATCVDDYISTLQPLLANAQSVSLVSEDDLQKQESVLQKYFLASLAVPTRACAGRSGSTPAQMTKVSVIAENARLLVADEALFVADRNETCQGSAFAFAAGVVAQTLFSLKQYENDLTLTDDMK